MYSETERKTGVLLASCHSLTIYTISTVIVKHLHLEIVIVKHLHLEDIFPKVHTPVYEILSWINRARDKTIIAKLHSLHRVGRV